MIIGLDYDSHKNISKCNYTSHGTNYTRWYWFSLKQLNVKQTLVGSTFNKWILVDGITPKIDYRMKQNTNMWNQLPKREHMFKLKENKVQLVDKIKHKPTKSITKNWLLDDCDLNNICINYKNILLDEIKLKPKKINYQKPIIRWLCAEEHPFKLKHTKIDYQNSVVRSWWFGANQHQGGWLLLEYA